MRLNLMGEFDVTYYVFEMAHLAFVSCVYKHINAKGYTVYSINYARFLLFAVLDLNGYLGPFYVSCSE